MGEEQKPWYPPGEGWIEWHGGPNPVPGAVVECLLECERRDRLPPDAEAPSTAWDWDYLDDPDFRIVAYRVVTPAPSTVDRALFDEMVEALEAISNMAPATQEVTVASMMADVADAILSKVREASK